VIGPWTSLAGGRGTNLAVDGERTAAAELARVSVWEGQHLISQVEASEVSPGRPRFVGERLCWGGASIDLASGQPTPTPGIALALATTGDIDLPYSPAGGYLPSAYAWSADGRLLIVAAGWTAAAGRPAVALAIEADSGRYTPLWRAAEPAPTAAWVSNTIVIGCRNPQVLDQHGTPITTLRSNTPPARIESDAGGVVFLILEHARLTLWQAVSWNVLNELAGSWLDAAISPNGQFIAAVGFDGSLRVGMTDQGLISMQVVATADPIASIALGNDRIVAKFATGAPVRTAPLRML
jgi:hypothetical protein